MFYSSIYEHNTLKNRWDGVLASMKHGMPKRLKKSDGSENDDDDDEGDDWDEDGWEYDEDQEEEEDTEAQKKASSTTKSDLTKLSLSYFEEVI